MAPGIPKQQASSRCGPDRSGVARLWRERRGGSAVEFALLSPILVFLAVGVYDMSVGIYCQMQINNAASAGAEFAFNNGFNAAAITAAITNATPYSSVAASPAPLQFCGCVTNGAVTASASCGAVCSDGATPGTYATVSASATYTPLFAYPGLPTTFALSAAATVRLQ